MPQGAPEVPHVTLERWLQMRAAPTIAAVPTPTGSAPSSAVPAPSHQQASAFHMPTASQHSVAAPDEHRVERYKWPVHGLPKSAWCADDKIVGVINVEHAGKNTQHTYLYFVFRRNLGGI
eukprot:359937-Chlamydomonas_euryale.AAC.2